MPLVERATESAPLSDIVFAVLDRFPDEEPAHAGGMGFTRAGARPIAAAGIRWLGCSSHELLFPGRVKEILAVPGMKVPSGARAGVKRKARMTSSNFLA